MTRVHRYLAAGLAVFCAARAQAQVQVGLHMKHRTFVQFEPVVAFVTVRNDSDKVFVIDTERMVKAGLRFVVENGRRDTMPRGDDRPLVTKLELYPEESRRIMRDVSRWYNMTVMGPYFVSAVVDWNGRTYRSPKVAIDVVRGLEITSTRKSLYGYPDEARIYSLCYPARERQETLFLRVDDERTGYTLGVFQLGPVIRVYQPSVAVDRLGSVTVLHQSSRNRFTRSVFESSRDGISFVDQTYQTLKPKPILPGMGGPREGRLLQE